MPTDGARSSGISASARSEGKSSDGNRSGRRRLSSTTFPGESNMPKTREFLLAGSFLIAIGPIPHGLAGEAGPLIMAQQAAPEVPERERQAPKAPPTKPPPPAAKGEPPAPPAARGQPPAGQPQRTQAPPREEAHRPL